MFSLDDIAPMVQGDGLTDLDRTRLLHKAAELDGLIGRLCAARDELRRAAACPAPRHADCPSFQNLLDRAAGRGPAGRRFIRPAD